MPKRVLLDECLPRQLKRHLTDHDVRTVPEAGWAGKENGELLALAADRHDVFVTVDRNLTFQQDLGSIRIAVIILVARGNRLVDLLPIVPALRSAIEDIEIGQVERLSAPKSEGR